MSGDHRPILELNQLAVGYNGVPLAPPLSAEVHRAETFFVVGPNGAGKSTLIKTVLGLLPPVSGSVRWHGEARVAYVQQRQGVDLTIRRRVVDFVAAGADTRRSVFHPLHLRRTRDVIAKAMADCDVTDLAHAQLAELSEGQRQRVLLARALTSEPRLLVLDEPTSAMDAMNEKAIFELMDKLQDARGLTLLLITHRLRELATVAHCGVMIDREHNAVMYGSLQEVWRSDMFLRRYGALGLAEVGA